MELDPLDIDVIVETVILCVSYTDDLLSCRQVCRKWREFATRELQSRIQEFPITFREKIKWEWWKGKPNTKRNKNMSDYISYLQTNPELIFNSFVFDYIKLSSPKVQNFLTLYGHSLEHLELNWNEVDSSEIDVPKIFKDLLTIQCPNLRTFCTREIPDELMHSGFLNKDYENSPVLKLKSLSFRFNAKPYKNRIRREIFECCTTLETFATFNTQGIGNILFDIADYPKVVSTLKELSFDFAFDQEMTHLYGHNEQLKLRKLSIQCLGISEPHRYFEASGGGDRSGYLLKLLEYHKYSLESLSIKDLFVHYWPNSPPLNIFAVEMPKLKELRFGNTNLIDFQLINVPLQFPSLELLILCSRPETDLGQFPASEPILVSSIAIANPHEKLKVLGLPLGYSFKLATLVFPNVHKLIAVLQLDGNLAENIQDIWNSWGQLETLHLKFISGQTDNFNNLDEFFISGGDKLSISNLTKLKEIKIEFGGDDRGQWISDSVVYEGFSRLPLLEYVEISKHNISEKAANFLCKSVPALKMYKYGRKSEFICKKYKSYIPEVLFPT